MPSSLVKDDRGFAFCGIICGHIAMYSHVSLNRLATSGFELGICQCICNMKGMSLAYAQATCCCGANCSQKGSLQTATAHVASVNMRIAIDLGMTLTASLMARLSPTRCVQLS